MEDLALPSSDRRTVLCVVAVGVATGLAGFRCPVYRYELAAEVFDFVDEVLEVEGVGCWWLLGAADGNGSKEIFLLASTANFWAGAEQRGVVHGLAYFEIYFPKIQMARRRGKTRASRFERQKRWAKRTVRGIFWIAEIR